ncbi:MAG: AI-2E family transporter [Clostridiales bacterium]|nr:AI-2E family transporter [Clostridiales bacterium]
MRNPIPQEERARVRVYTVIIAIAALFIAGLIYLSDIMSGLQRFMTAVRPFMVGVALAFIQYPIVKRLDWLISKAVSRKKPHPRLSRGISAALSLIVLLSFVILFMVILLPQLFKSFTQLYDSLKTVLQQNSNIVNDFLATHDMAFINIDGEQLSIAWMDMLAQFSSYSDSVFSFILSMSTTITSRVYNTLYPVFIGMIVAFYFLMEKEHLCAIGKKISYAMLSRESSEALIFWTRRATRIFSGFITGKLLDSLVIGVICYILMLIFRFDYALLISVIIGMTNILPFFGPIIGAVPSVLILLIVDPHQALWFAVMIIVLQQIDGNVLGPFILKDYVDISPIWILVSLLVGGGLFGFLGMLLSIPTFALLYAMVRAALERRLIRKGLPTSMAYYQDNDPGK